MPLVYGQDARVGAWMGAQMGLTTPCSGVTIGWEDELGRLQAALSFERVSGANVFVHIASNVTMPRSLLRAGCAYVFKQLEAVRCTFMVNDDNDECLALMRALDVDLEGRLKHGHPGGDTLLFALWPWNPFVLRLFKNVR